MGGASTALADQQPGDDVKDFEKVSIRINGGRTGLAERMRYWATAQQALGMAPGDHE